MSEDRTPTHLMGRYDADPELIALVDRLVVGPISDAKVEFLARSAHSRTPVAGHARRWDEDGHITRSVVWNEASRERARERARKVLMEAKERTA